MSASGPRSRGASAHPRPDQGGSLGSRTSAAPGLVRATRSSTAPWTRSPSRAASRARVPAGRGARRLRAGGDRARRQRSLVRPRRRLRAAAELIARAPRRRPDRVLLDERRACRASSARRSAARARAGACSSRARPTTGTLKILLGRGADVEAADGRARASPRRARGRAADGGRPGLRLHDPDLPEPERAHAAADRRAEMVELVRERELPLLEDDPYRLVRFEGEPLPTIFELARRDDRSTRSSFSKTIAPGLRVGGTCCPTSSRPLIEAVAVDVHHAGAARPGDGLGVHPPRELLAEPRARNGAAPGPARRDARRARQAAPRRCRWSRPEGGYFVWVELPAPARSPKRGAASGPRA